MLRWRSKRNDALFIAFALHENVSEIELQVFKSRPSNFRDAQAASIE